MSPSIQIRLIDRNFLRRLIHDVERREKNPYLCEYCMRICPQSDDLIPNPFSGMIQSDGLRCLE